MQSGGSNMKISIAENIKKNREKYRLSQDELGEKINVSGKTISSWEIGRTEPNMGYVQALCETFNITTDELIYSNKKDTNIYKALKLDYIYVPRFGNICCGNGGFSDDNVLEFVPVPSESLNDNKEYFCQYATGDSMADMIQEGDLIVFEKCSTPQPNTIGCFCVDENESMCKKFTIVNGVPILKPLNNDYDPVIVNTEDFRCVGILKKVIKTIE